MADPRPTQTEKVVDTAARDEVVALSVRNDGTLDQTNPKIIGPVDSAIAATKAQFAQTAVSAKDGYERRQELDAEAEARAGQDPVIAKRVKEHLAVAEAAEKKAEQVIRSLAR